MTRQPMTRYLVVLLVTLTTALSACGWHLRGKLPLAEKVNVLMVDADASSFRDQLVEALENADAVVVNDATSAKAVLRVNEFEYEREVRTLDSRGKVNGYTLIYIIEYEVLSSDGEVLRKSRRLKETADYNFDPLLVLGSELEEQEIRETMEEELVQRILRQLTTIT